MNSCNEVSDRAVVNPSTKESSMHIMYGYSITWAYGDIEILTLTCSRVKVRREPCLIMIIAKEITHPTSRKSFIKHILSFRVAFLIQPMCSFNVMDKVE